MSEEPGWYRAPRWSADTPAPEPPAVDGSVGVVGDLEDVDDVGADSDSPPTVADTTVDGTTPADVLGVDAVRTVDTVEVPDVLRIPVLPVDRAARLRRRVLIAVALLVAAVLIVVLLIESVGRLALQHVVEDEMAATGVAGTSEVRIGRSRWTPSLTRALLTGTMDRVEVDMEATDVVGLPVESLRYVLSDLGVSISLAGPRVAVTSLGSGEVTAVVDPRAFGALIGMPVAVRKGKVFLADADRPASLSIAGADLVVEDPQLVGLVGSDSFRFPVVDPYVLPCDPSPAVVGDQIVLTCSGSTMPGVLGGAFGVDGSTRAGDDTGAEVEIYAPGPIVAGD